MSDRKGKIMNGMDMSVVEIDHEAEHEKLEYEHHLLKEELERYKRALLNLAVKF